MARRCKYGKLKHPVGGRRCKRPVRHAKRRKASRRRTSSSHISAERARELEYIARHKASLGRHRRRR